jgi:hypothetical protein
MQKYYVDTKAAAKNLMAVCALNAHELGMAVTNEVID